MNQTNTLRRSYLSLSLPKLKRVIEITPQKDLSSSSSRSSTSSLNTHELSSNDEMEIFEWNIKKEELEKKIISSNGEIKSKEKYRRNSYSEMLSPLSDEDKTSLFREKKCVSELKIISKYSFNLSLLEDDYLLGGNHLSTLLRDHRDYEQFDEIKKNDLDKKTIEIKTQKRILNSKVFTGIKSMQNVLLKTPLQKRLLRRRCSEDLSPIDKQEIIKYTEEEEEEEIKEIKTKIYPFCPSSSNDIHATFPQCQHDILLSTKKIKQSDDSKLLQIVLKESFKSQTSISNKHNSKKVENKLSNKPKGSKRISKFFRHLRSG